MVKKAAVNECVGERVLCGDGGVMHVPPRMPRLLLNVCTTLRTRSLSPSSGTRPRHLPLEKISGVEDGARSTRSSAGTVSFLRPAIAGLGAKTGEAESKTSIYEPVG